MSEDKKDRISGVNKTQGPGSINRTQHVSEVQKTDRVEGVQKVGGIGSSQRKRTTLISAAEREELFKMIEEEASKLLGNASPERKQAIEEAVKMALDGGILEDEEEA